MNSAPVTHAWGHSPSSRGHKIDTTFAHTFWDLSTIDTCVAELSGGSESKAGSMEETNQIASLEQLDHLMAYFLILPYYARWRPMDELKYHRGLCLIAFLTLAGFHLQKSRGSYDFDYWYSRIAPSRLSCQWSSSMKVADTPIANSMDIWQLTRD